MRRKNFIIILLFIFINILSFSNENLPTVNTSINSMNPTYDESLKEYKIKSENTDSFYNYIKKMISEKDESIEKNVKLPSDSDVKVKKGDFVIVYKLADSDKIVKVKKVDHDDVPHGLMMKIHDMGKMHMKH